MCPKLSARTGLIYTIVMKNDDQNKVYGYYRTAIDFRTGETVWQKMAGTGHAFDTYYAGLGLGLNEIAYAGGYGGLISLRDMH